MRQQPSNHRQWTKGELAFLGMLLVHVCLLAYGAWYHGPTWDETGHLPAGVSHWKTGTFHLYRVNPPLVRMVAAIPVLASDADLSWLSNSTREYDGRGEWPAGREFIEANGVDTYWYFTLARWACIPFSIVGAAVCFFWARELYGELSGTLAAGLWCFSPNILAHGQLLTPDVGATAMGLLAFYTFWHWTKETTWSWTFLTGIFLGLALLAKGTWVILFLIWPLLSALTHALDAKSEKPKALWQRATRLIVVLLIGLYVLNVGFGFEGTATQLKAFRFRSSALTGSEHQTLQENDPQNRFAGTLLGKIPVPLPENYVLGIDLQKSEFEIGYWSYLRGEWKYGGWWYYYLYALAIKVPIGTWVLLGLSVTITLGAVQAPISWRDEVFLLTPVVAILALVSSQTGFNHHLRYVLPIFPFVFIYISKVAIVIQRRLPLLSAVLVITLCWSVGSSLYYFPHSLSYFNELVGGPRFGHDHLLDSNIDWGQDLLPLQRWLEKEGQPGACSIGLVYSLPQWLLDPKSVGINYEIPPAGLKTLDARKDDEVGPVPGRFAIFVRSLRERERDYEYFRYFEPVHLIGYSVYIYDISLEEANRVRSQLSLPLLPEDYRSAYICLPVSPTLERKPENAPTK
ncbi:ArnT family glycosyltransferase [Bremerella sp.]|uniref:ArnT family glycosyltransferase n=1 Tax=Bremerella sp. TaxID=2795602 RepID=UPI00391D7B83